jgi:hypothetical protein
MTSGTGKALLNKPRNKSKFRLDSDLFVKCQMEFFKPLFLPITLAEAPTVLTYIVAEGFFLLFSPVPPGRGWDSKLD